MWWCLRFLLVSLQMHIRLKGAILYFVFKFSLNSIIYLVLSFFLFHKQYLESLRLIHEFRLIQFGCLGSFSEVFSFANGAIRFQKCALTIGTLGFVMISHIQWLSRSTSLILQVPLNHFAFFGRFLITVWYVRHIVIVSLNWLLLLYLHYLWYLRDGTDFELRHVVAEVMIVQSYRLLVDGRLEGVFLVSFILLGQLLVHSSYLGQVIEVIVMAVQLLKGLNDFVFKVVLGEHDVLKIFTSCQLVTKLLQIVQKSHTFW